MIFPEFPRENDYIGICAPSAGVGNKLESFDMSLERLHQIGYSTFETESVRNDDIRSAEAAQRGAEFNSLVSEDAIKMIMSASGGDYNIEMLPYVDFEAVANNPQWITGSSDPTNLLYPITTCLDIATIYGVNAGSFDWEELHEFQYNALNILQGNIVVQDSFEMYDGSRDFSSDYCENTPVHWDLVTPDGSDYLEVSGRLIGGCIDCIAKLLGTPFDGASDFVERYKDEGIIWYFDPFLMNADALYMTLLQMKYSGYFEGTRAVVIGRVMFTEGSTDDDYAERLCRVFDDIPFIFNADIGHVRPTMTLINGATATFRCADGKGQLEMELR